MSCTTSFYSLMSSAEDEEDPETSATSGAASAKGLLSLALLFGEQK